MEEFIKNVFSKNINIKHINYKVIKPLHDGKSGAHVFEIENNKVLKLYKKRNGVVNDLSYVRAIRDIVMTSSTPDEISPHVYDFGINQELRPYLLMEKLEGIELYDYVPNGTKKDIEVLFGIVSALITFNKSMQTIYNIHHKGNFPTSHQDLHPHNIFLTSKGVRFIDFDLSICPYDVLKETNATGRQRALHHPWLQYILGNYSQSTEIYVNWNNLFGSVPQYIKDDSDIFQLYSIFKYFYAHNKGLGPLMAQIKKASSKEMFLKKSLYILKSLKQYTIHF